MPKDNLAELKKLVSKSKKKTRNMPVKASSWLMNVAKSLGYSAMDIFEEAMPNTLSYAKSAADIATEIRDTGFDLKQQKARLNNALDASVYLKLGKEAASNAWEDFKSGKFYNKERMQQYLDEQMNSDMDDIDIGGFEDFDDFDDDDFDVDLDSDDNGASVNVKRAHNGRNEATRITLVNNMGPDSPIVQATTLQTQVTAAGAEAVVNTSKVNTQLSLSMLSKVSSDNLKALVSVDKSITDMHTTLGSSLDRFASISETYFNDSMEIQRQMLDSIKIIQENTRVTAAASASKDPKNVPDVLSMFSGGVLNISDYKNYVKKNFSSWTDSNLVASSVKYMLSETDTIRQQYVASMLRSVPDMIVKQLIPRIVQTSMKSFDETLGETMSSALSKLGTYADSDNPIMSFLGQVFGLRTKRDTSVSKNRYEKGPVPWDGISHKTLNEVIPAYLRQIAAGVTGREEYAFDYDNGVFKKLSDIQRDHSEQLRSRALSEYSDDFDQFREMIRKEYVSTTKEQAQEYLDKFKDMTYQMVKDGGIPNYRRGKKPNEFGDFDDYLSRLVGTNSSDPYVTLVRSFFEGRHLAGDNAANMKYFHSKMQNARRAESELTAERESNPFLHNEQYINSGLEANVNTSMSKTGKTYLSDKGGFGADKYGYRPVYYLRNILETLNTGIRVKMDPTGGNLTGLSDIDQYAKKTLDRFKEDDKKWDREYVKHDTQLSDEKIAEQRNSGKLMVDETNEETMLARAQSYHQSRIDEENNTGERRKSIIERLAGSKFKAAKYFQVLNDKINSSAEGLQSVFNNANNLLYSLIFGFEEGDKRGSLLTNLITSMKLQFKKFGNFIDERVLTPLDEKMFGKDGLFEKIKQSDRFNKFKESLKRFGNKSSEFIFGKKITGDDGSVKFEGGLISNTMNEFKTAGNHLKDWFFGKKGPDGKPLPVDQDNSVFGNIKKAGLNISKSIGASLGIDSKDKDGKPISFKDNLKLQMHSVFDHVKGRFNEWTDLVLGTSSDPNNKEKKGNIVTNTISSFASEMKGKSGKLGAAAVTGAVGATVLGGKLGLLGSLFLPGGPIGGALMGLGIGIVSQSETLKTKLFGPQDDDGERTGGIISKEVLKFFTDNKTGIKLGAFAGLMSSLGFLPAMFVPGGPIGGALIGGALSMANKAGVFNKILYGDSEDKENPEGGIIGNFKKIFGKDKNLKGVAIDAGIGAGVGLIGSFFLPGGPLTGALLGSAASIVMNTNKFKDLMFGKEETTEIDGKKVTTRSGGLFGRFNDFMAEKVFIPFQKTVETAQASLMFFIKDKMLRPLQTSIAPITNKMKEAGATLSDGFRNMFKSIADKFHQAVTKPLGDTVDKYILSPLKKIAGGLFKAFTSVIGSIISSPFRFIGGVGQSIYESDKKRGARSVIFPGLQSAWKDASGQFSDSGGFKGGFLSGIINTFTSGKTLAGGVKKTFSKENLDKGRWSVAGAGKYATKENNPETMNAKLAEQNRSEYEDALAKINEKYNTKLNNRKLKNAKTGSSESIEKTLVESNQTQEETKVSINKVKDTAIEEASKNDKRHSETQSILGRILDSITAILHKSSGLDLPEFNGRSEVSNDKGTGKGGHGNRNRTINKYSKSKNKGKSSVTPETIKPTSSTSVSEDKNSVTKVSVPKQSEPQTRTTPTTKNNETKLSNTNQNVSFNRRDHNSVAKNVADIADSVHGQLNGVGLNINKIYRLLLKNLGMSDDDISGENNKQYVGFFGKILTKLHRPLEFVMDIVTYPFKVVGNVVSSLKDTVVNVVVGLKDAAKSVLSTLGSVALELISFPGKLVLAFAETVKALGPAIGETLKQGVRVIGDGLHLAASVLITGVNTLGSVISGAAKGFGEAVGETLAGLFSLAHGLGILTKDVLSGIGSVFKGGGKLVGGILSSGATLLKGAAAGIANSIHGGFGLTKGIVQPVYVVGGTLNTVECVDDVTKVGPNDKFVDLFDKLTDTIAKAVGSSSTTTSYTDENGVTHIARSGNSFGVNLKMFGHNVDTNHLNDIKEDEIAEKERTELSTRVANNSEAAIKQRQAEEDKETEQRTMFGKLIKAVESGNTENTKHHKSWSSIFGLKTGIITLGLIALAPTIINILKGLFSKFKDLEFTVSNIAKSLFKGFDMSGGLGGVLANANEQLTDATNLAGITDRTERSIDINGNQIYDENGNPVYTTKKDNIFGRFSQFISPEQTKIDHETGKLYKTREFNTTSESKANALIGTLIKTEKKTSGIIRKVSKFGANVAGVASDALTSAAVHIDDTVGLGKRGWDIVSKLDNKVSSAKTALSTSANGKGGIISKFIEFGKKAINKLLEKITSFLASKGMKPNSKITSMLSKLTGLLDDNILTRFSGKISKLMSKLGISIGTGLAADIGMGLFGAINVNPAQMFQVSEDKVDGKMQAIARLFKAFLSTSFGSTFDLIASIGTEIFGFDVVSELAVLLYNLLCSEEERTALATNRMEFKDSYDTYSQEEYAAYAKNETANGRTPMTYDEFKQSDIATDFTEYNSSQNKTMLRKGVDVAKGVAGTVGTTLNKVGTSLGWNSKDSLGGNLLNIGKNLIKDPTTFMVPGLKVVSTAIDVASNKQAYFDVYGGFYVERSDGGYDYYNANSEFIRSLSAEESDDVRAQISAGMLTVGRVPSVTRSTASKVVTGIKDKAKEFWNSAKDKIGNAWNSAKSWLGSVGSNIANWWNGDSKNTTNERNAAGEDTVTSVQKPDTANGFPFLLQGDARWGQKPYTAINDSSQTIATSGCGTTSMAMVLRSFGNNVSPVDTAAYSTEKGFRTANSGTSWSFFPAISKEFGLNATNLGKDTSAVATALSQGKPVIASMGPSTFTRSGHFIVLSGASPDGTIMVNDPASAERTGKRWPLSVFAKEGKNFWSFDKGGVGSIGNVADVASIQSTADQSYNSNAVGDTTVGETGTQKKFTSFRELLSSLASSIFGPVMEQFGLSIGDSPTYGISSDNSNYTGTNISTGTPVNMSGDYLGKHVAQFESGIKGPAMISSGKGDYGGVSFGSYQFPSYKKEVADSDSNLALFWNKYYAGKYPGVSPGDNQAFKDAWLKEAQVDKEGFFANEHEFIKSKYYDVLKPKIKQYVDLDTYDRAAQEAAWSTAVQLGPGNLAVDAFKGATNGQKVDSNTDPKTFINNLMNYKVSKIPSWFTKSSQSVKNSIKNRYDVGERGVLVGLAGNKPIEQTVSGGDRHGITALTKIHSTDNSVTSNETNASGPVTKVNQESTIKNNLNRPYTSPIPVSVGGFDLESANKVIYFLGQILDELKGTNSGIENLNNKEFKTTNYTDNSTTNQNYNKVSNTSQTSKPSPGPNRSAYPVAKQLAQGLILA